MLFIVAFQKSFGVDFYSLEEGGGGMKIGSPRKIPKRFKNDRWETTMEIYGQIPPNKLNMGLINIVS